MISVLEFLQSNWWASLVITAILGYCMYQIWHRTFIVPARRRTFVEIFGFQPRRSDRQQMDSVRIELGILERETRFRKGFEKNATEVKLRRAISLAEFFFGEDVALLNACLEDYLPAGAKRRLKEKRANTAR